MEQTCQEVVGQFGDFPFSAEASQPVHATDCHRAVIPGRAIWQGAALRRVHLRRALLALHYRGNVSSMALAQSKVTAQGQISVPAEIRKKLGLGPGSVLEWEEKSGEIIVRKAGRHTSAEVHEALFGGESKPKSKVNVKEAIRRHIRQRHARD